MSLEGNTMRYLCHAADRRLLTGAKEEDEGGLTFTQYLYAIQWICVSGGMTLFNKYVLDKTRGNFPYPMVLTSWHMSVPIVCVSCPSDEGFVPGFFALSVLGFSS